MLSNILDQIQSRCVNDLVLFQLVQDARENMGRHFFPILEDNDDGEFEATLEVRVTEEGIICDVTDASGEVIKTWGIMAQEISDELCH